MIPAGESGSWWQVTIGLCLVLGACFFFLCFGSQIEPEIREAIGLPALEPQGGRDE